VGSKRGVVKRIFPGVQDLENYITRHFVVTCDPTGDNDRKAVGKESDSSLRTRLPE